MEEEKQVAVGVLPSFPLYQSPNVIILSFFPPSLLSVGHLLNNIDKNPTISVDILTMAAIEEEESKKEGDEEEGEGLTPKEPLKGVQKKEPKNTKTIDIHWNYQSSFTSIKLIIVIMLISELITSLGLVIFCFTNPGDPMLDITMGSFVVSA